MTMVFTYGYVRGILIRIGWLLQDTNASRTHSVTSLDMLYYIHKEKLAAVIIQRSSQL